MFVRIAGSPVWATLSSEKRRGFAVRALGVAPSPMNPRRNIVPARRISVALALGVLLLPAVTFAWSQKADFGARVHKHEFSRVLLTNDGCTLKARLFFDAPAEAYGDEFATKNYYRFHARIRLDNAHDVMTRIFHNDAPGAREYDYDQDTTSEGCWAKAEAHARDVNVEGCRGRGCTPENFK